MVLPYPRTLPPSPWLSEQDSSPPPPVRYCRCGNAIGDGDYASGYRQCALCRRLPRQRRYR